MRHRFIWSPKGAFPFAAPVMQRAGGCKECALSKINPGNGGEGNGARPKPQALLLIPTCPKAFAPLLVLGECLQIWSSSSQEGSALDRCCVFPQTCCSPTPLAGRLLQLPWSWHTWNIHPPRSTKVRAVLWCDHNPEGMAQDFLYEIKKMDTQRPKPALCP